MKSEIFRTEDMKYSDLWQDGYTDANWIKLARAALSKVHPNGHAISLIDFGFGKCNEFFCRKWILC